MMRVTAALGLLGLIAATALFLWHGVGSVLHIFATAGLGILWVAVSHFISMGLNARAWQIIVPPSRPSVGFFLWAVWLRESVNSLLPVARIGGEVVTAGLLMRQGLSPAMAVGSLVIDVTLCIGSQIVFTLAGIALLLVQNREIPIVRDIMIAVIVAIPLTILFIVAQRSGLFSLLMTFGKVLFGDRLASLAVTADGLDRKINRLYRRRLALLRCGVWQLAGFAAGALEIWLSLYFLDSPFSVIDSLILESLIQALSSSAFVVPGALGVQEAGFVFIGGVLSLSPETALAVALMRRARDIIVFTPALLAWQFSWGKRLLLSHNGSKSVG